MADNATDGKANLLLEAPQAEREPARVNLKRLFRLRRKLMIVVFVAAVIPMALAVWYLAPKQYTASAEVRFMASTPKVMDQGGGNASNVPYEKFLNTQVSLITGSAVLSRVLEDPEVRTLPWIAGQEDPLEFLKNVVKAENRPNSELVTIACTLPDREAARTIVDKTLSVYMTYALGEEANIGGERLRILLKERDRRTRELDDQLQRINELQRQLGLPLESASQLGSEDLAAYREMVAEAEGELSEAKAQLDRARKNEQRVERLLAAHEETPNSAIFDLSVEDKVAVDPRVVTLRQDLVRAEAAYAQKTKRFADASPQLQVERENVASLRSEVAQTERSVRGEVLASLSAQAEADAAAAEADIEDAEERKERFELVLNEQRQRALAVSQALAEIDELKMRAEETRDLLRALRQEITSIGVESNAPARVKVASPAIVPVNPDMGKRLQLLLLAVLAAGGLALCVGFFRELTDQTVRSAEDIAQITRAPVLAAIPDAGLDRIPKQSNMTAVVADWPDTNSANEYRRVLSQLAFSADETALEIGSCLVTSPTQGDGKTTVACNLAVALAEANRQVLLIDIAPNGHVEERFGLEPARGFSDVVSGGYLLLDVVRESGRPNLSILGPGFKADQLATKLASREAVELLAETEEHFDHVIIDGPPALLFSDARLLGPIVDGVVLVVGAGVSKLGMASRCVRELDQVGANILGVVLNRIKASPGGYLRRNLEIMDSYYAQDQQKRFPEDLPAIEVLDVEPESHAAMEGAEADVEGQIR